MEIERFTDGTPCWFDLFSSDPDAAASFYANVLGWAIESGGPESGGYKMCILGDRPVAGIMGQSADGVASTWTPYLRSSDLTSTLAAVAQAGGSTIVGPMDVLDLGHLAVVLDVTGASIGVWEPSTFEGAGRVGEPGAYLWAELTTSSLDRSTAFFEEVFGLQATEESATSSDARQFTKGGHPIIGMVAHEPGDGEADGWTLTFMVSDLEDTLVRAVTGGGFLGGPIVELPVGRHATVTDPTGAMFGLLEPGH